MVKDSCVVCEGKDLHKAMDFGLMPNSNGLVSKEHLGEVKSYPLSFYWCSNCGLLQQLDVVSREDLFRDEYTYQTGASAPAVAHFTALAQEIGKRASQTNLALVIASNDGTEIDLMGRFGKFKKVIGVEPAKNIAALANGRGFQTIPEFFTCELSEKILREQGKADVIIANNVFAHIPDPSDMLRGIANLLSEDGYAVIEVQWLADVVRKLAIDTLYAEHYYEWTTKAMRTLANKCNMRLVDVEHLPDLHGGSLRFWLRLKGDETSKLESEEIKAGIYDLDTIRQLQARADVRRLKFQALMEKLRAANCTVDIWAVPAKVPTLLNFCKIDGRYLRA